MSAPDHLFATLLSASSTLSQTIATATATVTASAAPSSTSVHSTAGAKDGKCELLGPFAILVQAALGGLALLSLVYKRWRERPQRPVKIWAFDASKQVVGSVLLHLANLLLSMVSSGDMTAGPPASGDYKANPCSFYLLNLGIDTTIGIPILILWLKVLTVGFSKTPLGRPAESIKSGNYGSPPRASWWLKQSFIYFLGLLGMKLCVYFLFIILPWIIYAGDWALRWTEGNEQLQIAFVMLLFPLIMNALQYYIIDGFIKNGEDSGGHHQLLAEGDEEGEQGENGEERRGLRNAWDATFESDDDEDEVGRAKKLERKREKRRAKKKGPGATQKDLDEYDSEQDGESSGSGRRRREEGDK